MSESRERLPPWRTFLASDDAIRHLIRTSRTLAFAGALDAEIERRLIERGFRVVAVRDASELRALDERIDVVVVCDPAAPIEALADAAHARGVTGFWLERGLMNPHAALHAARLGLTVAMDRSILGECLMHFPDDEVGYP